MNRLNRLNKQWVGAVAGAVSRRDALAALGAAGIGMPCLARQVMRPSGPIMLGQTAGFSGAAAGTVHELTVGAFMHLKAINAQGGIQGRPVRLFQMDDGSQPERAAKNAVALIAQGVVGLFLTTGTPTNELILKAVGSAAPIIAPSTGAMSLREPVLSNVFNVRSSYRLEGRRMVLDLNALSFTRVGVIAVNDSFGSDVMAGILPTLRSSGIEPSFVERFDAQATTFEGIGQAAARSPAQAVIIVGATAPTARIVRSLRAAGCTSMVATTSTNASAEFVSQLGPQARGIGVMTVTPKTRQVGIAMVANATRALQEYNATATTKFAALTPAMLEGYASALVLVEGLRRAQSDAPQALIEAFDSIVNFSLGWRSISFSPANHRGLDFAELSVIDSEGKFVY